MADLQITGLLALAEAGVQATDPLAIADVSASETKKVTVKDLIAAGVAFIDDGDIPAGKVGTLGTDQVASGAIQSGAVTNIKIETSTSSTTGIDGGTKIRAGSITVDRLDTTKFDRGLTVVNSKLGIGNSITANTTGAAKVKYDDQGLITGTASLVAADMPKATATTIGAISVPTSGKLAVDANGVISIATIDGLSASSYTKVTVNTQGQVTAATNLGAADLPAATTTAKGAVIVPSSGGLAVDGSGNISLAGQTAFTADQSYTKVTVNAKGIITATGSLADTDIPNHSAQKLTSGTLPADRIGTGAINSDRIDAGAVTNAKVESSTSATTGLDGATKIRNGTITPAKLNTSNLDRSLNVASGNLGINNTITAATRSGITYNAQGLITETVALIASDLPLATTSAVGGVSVGTGLSVSGAGALSLATSVTGATVSGITFNNTGQITAATGLVASDLPTATTSAKGAVQITSGGGLTVDGSGNLTTSTSGISAGTYQSITINNKGVATAGAALTAALIPDLAATKITSGSFDAARIAAGSIDGTKLSNTSTTIFQSITQSGYPTAQFNGQLLFDTVSEDAYIWDGTAWQAITTLTKGSLRFGGTYNAATSQMISCTSEGISSGLTVGSNLPTPSANTDGLYVVISVGNTSGSYPSAPAPQKDFAPPDYILGVTTSSTSSSWQEIDLSATIAGQVASNITYSPSGSGIDGVSATNVQSAIEELASEKLAKAGGTVTGEILIGTGGSLVFEGATADAYETTLTVADPTTSDKTITFPDTTGTVITSGDTNTVTSTMVDASLVNANLAAGAAIAFSKLAALPSAQIIVGNGSTVPTAVSVTGDISINNAGLTAITAGAIVDADISGSAAITGSKIATGTTSAVGVLQLTNAADSTSATTAATPAAVKTAKDAADAAATTANAALPKAGGTMTDNLIIDNAKQIRFTEADANGANYVSLQAPDTLAADTSYTLPSALPTANGQVLASTTGGVLSWTEDPTGGWVTSGDNISYSAGDVSFTGASSKNMVWDKSDGQLEFADSAKAVFGAGSDLSIYHDSSTNHSFIKETGTGSLVINANDFYVQNVATETMIKAASDGAVELYHNSIKTLATQANGITVLGPEGGNAEIQLLADEGDDYADNWRIQVDTSGNFKIANASTESWVNGLTLDGSNNATFAGTVTSAGLTVDTNTLHVDATNNRVGIGTTSPNEEFTVQAGDILVRSDVTTGSSNSHAIGFSATATGGLAASISSYRENANEASALTFKTWNGSATGERMRLDSSGNLGIGTTEPQFKVDVNGELASKNASKEFLALHLTNNEARIRSSFYSGASGAYRPITFFTSDNERMRIDTSGRLLLGTTSAITTSSARLLQVLGDDSGGIIALGRNDTTLTNEGLGGIEFYGNDPGSAYTRTAGIYCDAAAAWGSGDYPSKLIFKTTPDGSSTNTTALTLDSSQNATFAGTVSDSKGNLRDIPVNSKSTGYTLAASDAGKVITNTTGGWTIPSSTFSTGKTITLLNESGSAQNITASALTSLYNTADGTNIKSSTIALGARSMATIWFSGSEHGYIQASSLTVS